jgi:hypothetical protein
METTPFEFTPKQQKLLQSLAEKTGKSISVLLDQWLEEMEEHVRPADVNGQPNGGDIEPEEEPASVLDMFQAAWEAIPEEELENLPTDLAAQHDHYIYGTPKRPS